MIFDLLSAFWFFAPAGLANVMAFFSGKIPALKKLSYPVDCNIRFRGKRLLGSHKTIRGFVAGILAGIIGVLVQIYLFNNVSFFKNISFIDYSEINPIILGTLLGGGALVGDAIKSFFKRQAGIQPGRSWFPFDQSDYILGGIILSWFYIKLDLWQYLLIFVLWFLIHPLTTFLGYLLKLKRKPL